VLHGCAGVGARGSLHRLHHLVRPRREREQAAVRHTSRVRLEVGRQQGEELGASTHERRVGRVEHDRRHLLGEAETAILLVEQLEGIRSAAPRLDVARLVVELGGELGGTERPALLQRLEQTCAAPDVHYPGAEEAGVGAGDSREDVVSRCGHAGSSATARTGDPVPFSQASG